LHRVVFPLLGLPVIRSFILDESYYPRLINYRVVLWWGCSGFEEDDSEGRALILADQKDQRHERAKGLSKKADNEVVVTDFILSESVTAVGARGGGKAGLAVYEYILK